MTLPKRANGNIMQEAGRKKNTTRMIRFPPPTPRHPPHPGWGVGVGVRPPPGHGGIRLSGETRPRLCGGCPVHATWPRDGHKELQNRPPKSHGRTIFVPAAPSSPRGLKNKEKPVCSPAAATKRAKIAQRTPKISQKSPKRSHHPLFFAWFLSATSEKQPTPPHHQLTQGGTHLYLFLQDGSYEK